MTGLSADNAAPFILHPQLAADCRIIGRFELSLVLMMNDANYPWFILVPQRPGVRELYQLDDVDQLLLLKESVRLGRAMMAVFAGEKLNVAALGNMVPQLHLHHIVRYSSDLSWPAPVWGKLPAKPYTEAVWSERVSQLSTQLPELSPT